MNYLDNDVQPVDIPLIVTDPEPTLLVGSAVLEASISAGKSAVFPVEAR